MHCPLRGDNRPRDVEADPDFKSTANELFGDA